MQIFICAGGKLDLTGNGKAFRENIIVCPGAYNKYNTGVVLQIGEELE
jgi:hypothetical protein